MLSASISTPRCRNISEYYHSVRLFYHTAQNPSSDFHAFNGAIGHAPCELTALTSCSRTQGGIFTTPGDAYTTPVDMWVKALGVSPFHSLLTQRKQFLFPAFTLSFFGISISLIPHADLLLEKLHRNHDLGRIRAIGGSAQVGVPLLSLNLHNVSHPFCSTLLFGGRQTRFQI